MEFEEIFSIFILDIVHIDASFEFFGVFQFLTGEELSGNMASYRWIADLSNHARIFIQLRKGYNFYILSTILALAYRIIDERMSLNSFFIFILVMIESYSNRLKIR